MKNQTQYSHGQTLLEIVITVGVVAVILTALVSAVTASLRYGVASRSRSRAIKYAQEGLELARAYRDTSGWDTFLERSGTGTKNWCLDENGIWTEDTTSDCPLSEDSLFGRTVTYIWNDPLMSVLVSVAWGEKNEAQTVNLQTYFTQWK